MTIEWGLLWAIMLAMILAPLASRADVCQKGAEVRRIKMVEQPDGRYRFQVCERANRPCVPLGPADQSFTREELLAKRDAMDAKRAGYESSRTAGGLLTVFLFPLGAVGEAGEAAKVAKEAKAKAAALARDMKVLAPELLTTDAACTDVGSLVSHRLTLARLLKEIADKRFKDALAAAAAASSSQQSSASPAARPDQRDSKAVAPSAQPQPSQPVPAPRPANSGERPTDD